MVIFYVSLPEDMGENMLVHQKLWAYSHYSPITFINNLSLTNAHWFGTHQNWSELLWYRPRKSVVISTKQ
jgi:hypothetical protein